MYVIVENVVIKEGIRGGEYEQGEVTKNQR